MNVDKIIAKNYKKFSAGESSLETIKSKNKINKNK
jgi:hypothetical protein